MKNESIAIAVAYDPNKVAFAGHSDQSSTSDELDDLSIDNVKNVDCILLGRKTAEGFIPHWTGVMSDPANSSYTDSDRRLAKPMTAIPKVIFSNTVEDNKWDNATIINGDIKEEILRLKKQPGKDIIVYGGYSFVLSLMEHALIDEFHILLNPLTPVAAQGEQPILNKLKENPQITLTTCKSFPGGVILLNYQSK